MNDPHTATHQALQGFVDDGELVVAWHVTVEVAGPDDQRYLAHRAGGGLDGTDPPTVWNVVGMLDAARSTARDQLWTCPEEDEVDDD